MDRDALIQRLMVTFAEELGEHARVIERGALALVEGTADDQEAVISTIFRAAHSLKGASRAVDIPSIESTCHALETVLGELREGSESITSGLLDAILAASDTLKQAHRRLQAGESVDGAALDVVIRHLESRRVDPKPVASDENGGARRRAPPPQRRAAEPATARVAADKLDALITMSGQLMVARRRQEDRRDEVESIRNLVSRLRSEWRRVERGGWTHTLGRQPGARRTGGSDSVVAKRRSAAIERTRADLREIERRLERLSARVAADDHALTLAADPLDDGIRRLRMVPFSEACVDLPRVIHDLARDAGKQVELRLEGDDIEVDRAVIDTLKDPMVHLVRNAIDHGIEGPDERAAAGKPVQATITVAAALRSNDIAIVVSDDGRGIDLDQVRRVAERRAMSPPNDDRDALSYLFAPGFTTAPSVTAVSGRGVGLEVVKHCVEGLHGHVDISSELGRGARFSLVVPLTLSKIRALMIREGSDIFAVPTANVRRVGRVERSCVRSLDGRDVLPVLAAAPIPIGSLSTTLGIERALPSAEVMTVVFVHAGGNEVALVVDELVNEQEIVVKGLGARIRRARWFSGTTILANGRLALILHAPDVVSSALASAGRIPASRACTARRASKQRVLIVDDSITTRSLEKSIVEAAGYEVLVAVDGEDGWRVLQERGADLVVADVEMPRMDGIVLCRTIRESPRFENLPVILVTGLDSEEDRVRGLHAGANAYLPKSRFDQRELLETIGRLV